MAADHEEAHTNGVNGHTEYDGYPRFSDIPAVIDIPVRGEDGDEAVNLDLTELLDETDELCDLLENEHAARNYWITIALAYAKQGKVDVAIDILTKGLQALGGAKAEDRLSVLTCLCWLNLWKCRHAPRVKPTQPIEDERPKEYWLHQATSMLNEASRISPSYPPLFLARGTLYLLRASLQPVKAGPGAKEQSDRVDTLKQASKCFDDAYRVSTGKNIMAVMGKAKAQFSLGSYAPALQLYQSALERAPDLIDPDPRIGIGCCLWQLGHKEAARSAWQRSLDLNNDSHVANVLLGISYLDESGQYSTNDPEFRDIYSTAMTKHVQKAFKLDGMNALTCATFGTYFLLRKQWTNVERLARRAIEHTDVNATASDGWYLLARKDHFEGELTKAAEHYTKADQARGGDERGYLPAKFGAAQLRTEMQDFDGAKFRLEKMVEKSKSIEAMTLLGILHAEAVFANQASSSKEDRSLEARRAIALLEQVRLACKGPKRKITPDAAVLLNLARLYETDQPEKALGCLQQVEQMELAEISEEDLPEDVGDEAEERRFRRELLNPQLLNNIGCLQFQAERYSEAREDLQTALNACVKLGDRSSEDPGFDTDALVSTISYNLARTYEAENMDDEAQKVYRGLLERHPDYIDANTRLAYISLRVEPESGAEAIKELLQTQPGNLEVRGLYGWYINRAKKRTLALNEDQEQRHFKQTLQTYDKHDLYSLTGMGNLHLLVAREMPRTTDQHKERRSKIYMRAVEFFDKVLMLDPKNAFAAQGLGIAMIEEKRDTSSAIQIFSKVRESIKDASVHINLGHVFAEVKQFSRAIENYELALAKSKEQDPQILACLGRVWLMRGRQEKKLEAYKTSLDISRQALEVAPSNINFRFNVAFVQIQLAQMLISLPESQKTSEDMQAASEGLDDAIASFGEIAKAPTPPFPRHDIEQRANMGRNTMKRQLTGAIERQIEYERKNKDRLEAARRKREEEVRRREEEKRMAAEQAEEERRKIKEERERMMEEDRALIARRLEEERLREAAEWTTDEETGERRKREKKPREKRAKRKKKGEDSDSDPEGTDDVDAEAGGDAAGRKSRQRSAVNSSAASEGEGGSRRKTKKRKLERKGRVSATISSKYKSADTVEDSSDDEDGLAVAAPNSDALPEDEEGAELAVTPGADDEEMFDEEEEEVEPEVSAAKVAQRKRVARILDDEEDDDDEAKPANGNGETAAGESDHGGDGIE